MHKEFKDAYDRSNKVDTTPQMITTYMRDNGLMMTYLAIQTWNNVQQKTPQAQHLRLQSTKSLVFLKLEGTISSGVV